MAHSRTNHGQASTGLTWKALITEVPLRGVGRRNEEESKVRVSIIYPSCEICTEECMADARATDTGIRDEVIAWSRNWL